MSIVLKRVYEEESEIGGYRILVDRVWPRGISKQRANLDKWLKELAPSTSLRKWFNHDPDKFNAFSQAYKEELEQNEQQRSMLQDLRELSKNGSVVLLYGSKDKQYNHAGVLKDLLEKGSWL
ncbi:hypothetical protein J32TS6_17470 [Virgibacillus pantothenticus]|uniref:DUF488 domain-containing protein n=1 Tax=Virgibacillus pantothenticus TaxID=1473 RepID=UPI001AFD4CA2|nr:DUF488 domain-containing protein [Virgibacillus pantothenticus]GIP63192.1 hypothetical protein J32TS6_17470 [Virgibacillus pantothenticus]